MGLLVGRGAFHLLGSVDCFFASESTSFIWISCHIDNYSLTSSTRYPSTGSSLSPLLVGAGTGSLFSFCRFIGLVMAKGEDLQNRNSCLSGNMDRGES